MARHGYAVPGRFKVVGINNELIAEQSYPGLSSFRIPYELHGAGKGLESMAVKQRSTHYTPLKVEAMRRNANVYEWAKREKERAASLADVYVQLGWEWLWNVPTPQSLPRSYAVNQQAGCPVCGEKHHV